MSAIRICHLADIHLGYRRFSRLNRQGFNQREADVSASFKEALTLAAQQQPSLTIIAGDLFHAVRPSNAVLNFCLQQLKSYTTKTKTPVVIVAGNHETPRRSDTGSALQILASLDLVYVVDQQYQRLNFRQLDMSIDCVPHAALAEFDWKKLRSSTEAKTNILITHAQVRGAPGSEGGGYEIDLADIRKSDWDYIALGHVHTELWFGDNCSYSGSTDFTSNNIWAECKEEKGFVVYDLKERTKKTIILSSLRKILDFPIIDAKGREAAELDALLEQNIKLANGIEDKIIRQRIINLERHIYKQLDQKNIRKYRRQALHYYLETEFNSVRIIPDRSLSQIQNIENGLKKFCLEQDLPTGQDQAVLNLLNNYLLKVEQHDEAN